MFLKSLTITHGDGAIIRDIRFHAGLNLIVDETPVVSGKETGNNVGKTTVLKLIDFCLGAKANEIYSDYENKRNEYKLVKDFLVDQKVRISLVLKEDLSQEESRKVLIERNFLPYNKGKIQRIELDQILREKFSNRRIDSSLHHFIKLGYLSQDETGNLYLDWRTRAEIDPKVLLKLIMSEEKKKSSQESS